MEPTMDVGDGIRLPLKTVMADGLPTNFTTNPMNYNYMGNNIYHPGYVSTCENGDETKENVPNYLRKRLKNTPQKRRTHNKRSFFLNKNSILRMRV